MKDSRERFSAVAADYDRFRPSYPAGILDWIAATTGVPAGGRVVDLGCGTGIFSRLLAARGFTVVGIDPNEDMLASARAMGGGPTYSLGEAIRTGVPDASADLVTAAQAFHWFDLAPTLAEVRRILAPHGWTAAVWNVRVTSPFNDEYEQLLLACSSEYARMSDTLDPRLPIVEAIAGAATTELLTEDLLPWDAVIGRVRSASYVVHGVADLPELERRLREAYERHARPDGTLAWRMRTVAIAWPRAAGPERLL